VGRIKKEEEEKALNLLQKNINLRDVRADLGLKIITSGLDRRGEEIGSGGSWKQLTDKH
jgi:hypothetical protein